MHIRVDNTEMSIHIGGKILGDIGNWFKEYCLFFWAIIST